MKCGVKFCGGCNPKYERGEAYNYLKNYFRGQIDFAYAEEGVLYDALLVIGGCTNCCASFSQYKSKRECIKMWDKNHIESVVNDLQKIINE